MASKAVAFNGGAMNTKLLDQAFGPSLASVSERDIDLLLLEEFNASEAFLRWFCSEAGVPEAKLAGAWHSVANSYGESDLLLTVRSNGSTVGILIENKIDASEQKEQAARYRARAEQYVKDGLMQSFKTAMCAPEIYVSSLSEPNIYDVYVEYEKIGLWFEACANARGRWRAYAIATAINQAKRGYKMVVNDKKTEFQRHYWEYVRANYPGIVMAEPKVRGNMSYWIILRTDEFPKGVYIHHKFNSSTVELGFNKRSVDELRARRDIWENGQIYLQQKGKTAALVVNVPLIDMAADFFSQKEAVEKALQAVVQLMPFANILEDVQPMSDPRQNADRAGTHWNSESELSRFEKLLPFLDAFEHPDFAFAYQGRGGPGRSRSPTMTETALAFMKTAYDADCVEVFDWMSWGDTDEGRKLLADPSEIDRADARNLIRLLTFYLRQDRFVDGALARAFEQGALTAILRRAKALATQSPGHGAE